jgi:hypothetical protein
MIDTMTWTEIGGKTPVHHESDKLGKVCPEVVLMERSGKISMARL